MKNIKGFMLIFILSFAFQQVTAQYVHIGEASPIADQWIQMVIDKYGQWGGYESAFAGPIQELRQNDRLIGYYCHVKPKGYIIFSFRRELAPVKAYSDRKNINLSRNQGLAHLIKSRMLGIIHGIESRLGPVESVTTFELTAISRMDYRQSWDDIENYIPGTIQKRVYAEETIEANYLEGDSLLDCRWHQKSPYNNLCPFMACTTTTNGCALVGCGATAAAQIMKYWDWPPFGEGGSMYSDTYDWINMHNVVDSTSHPAEQAAVSELNYEVGVANNTTYGCEESSAGLYATESALNNNFRYSNSSQVHKRSDFGPHAWFDLIKDQIDQNRPILYRIGTGTTAGHFIVCDGWQEIGALMQYHMNYGYGASATTWYSLDDLWASEVDYEYMIENIIPYTALGPVFLGTYSTSSFPYRYFDQDASSFSAVFEFGQFLQTLPDITISANNGLSSNVSFSGNVGMPTKIYTDGDPSKGVVIREGTLKLTNGGSIKLP